MCSQDSYLPGLWDAPCNCLNESLPGGRWDLHLELNCSVDCQKRAVYKILGASSAPELKALGDHGHWVMTEHVTLLLISRWVEQLESYDWLTQCTWRTAPRGRVTHIAAVHGMDSYWKSSWRTVSCVRDPTEEQGRTPLPEQQQKQRVMNSP